MGVSISSWIGQQVTSITYSDINLTNFLKMKGLTKNTKAFPYSTVKEFVFIYMDDLLVCTNEDQENASKIHLIAVEFVLYCSKIMGLTFAWNKTVSMSNLFEFWDMNSIIQLIAYQLPEEITSRICETQEVKQRRFPGLVAFHILRKLCLNSAKLLHPCSTC